MNDQQQIRRNLCLLAGGQLLQMLDTPQCRGIRKQCNAVLFQRNAFDLQKGLDIAVHDGEIEAGAAVSDFTAEYGVRREQ